MNNHKDGQNCRNCRQIDGNAKVSDRKSVDGEMEKKDHREGDS